MRLIELEKALQIAEYYSARDFSPPVGMLKISDVIYYEIAQLPTIEAEPVKHGKWLTYDYGTTCSACKEEAICERNAWGDIERYIKTDYCPWCGAKMEGDI